MSVPHAIRLLMYGYDPVLMETRRSILKNAGFSRCTVADPRNFKGALEAVSAPYDLLVICHSVPAEERVSIAFAQRHIPVFQIERLIAPQTLVSEVSRLTGHLPQD